MSEIGKRIKERRLKIGLSVDELAEKLGKNRATLYRYENGDIENLPLNILEPLAQALNTTPAYLMGWDYSLKAIVNYIYTTEESDKAFDFSGITPEDKNKIDTLYQDYASLDAARDFAHILQTESVNDCYSEAEEKLNEAYTLFDEASELRQDSDRLIEKAKILIAEAKKSHNGAANILDLLYNLPEKIEVAENNLKCVLEKYRIRDK